MIDWASVKSVSIPEGDVKQINIDGVTVWTKKQSRLPDGYQELTYIGCTGTQFINTGLRPSVNCAFYIRYQETTASGSNYAFGSRGSGSTYYAGLGGGTNTHNVAVLNHSTTTPNSYRATGNVYEISAEYNSAGTGTSTIKCETTGDIFEGAQTATYRENGAYICVFAQRVNAKHPGMNVFEVKLWNDDVLERHLIPCQRISDDELGMYDLVNNVFYTNSGTGEFTAGSVVN